MKPRNWSATRPNRLLSANALVPAIVLGLAGRAIVN
jgi:hypothetical protein